MNCEILYTGPNYLCLLPMGTLTNEFFGEIKTADSQMCYHYNLSMTTHGFSSLYY